MPGEIIGDPYVTKLDGTSFEFTGEDAKVYDFFSTHGLRVLTRVCRTPGHDGRSHVCSTDIIVGEGDDKVWVVVTPDGVTWVHAHGHRVKVQTKACTLDAPGHLGNTQDEPHPLQGVPHENVSLDHPPDLDLSACTGLTIDGSSAADPSGYEVPL